jgi:hypothetical protein
VIDHARRFPPPWSMAIILPARDDDVLRASRRRCLLAKFGQDNAASAPWWRPQRPKRKSRITDLIMGKPDESSPPGLSPGSPGCTTPAGAPLLMQTRLNDGKPFPLSQWLAGCNSCRSGPCRWRRTIGPLSLCPAPRCASRNLNTNTRWYPPRSACLAVHQSGRSGRESIMTDAVIVQVIALSACVCVGIRDTHATGGVPMRPQASSSWS